MKAIDEIELLGTIIENNYCSGCGVCTAATNSNFKMSLTENGNYQPILFNEKEKTTTTVCPFADHGFDEDDIAKERFSQIENIKYSDKIGYYYGLYAGHVETDNYRLKGSSGGSVSWLTSALIEEGLVDYVVHVKEAKNEEVFFEYAVSSSIEEIKEGAKSRYYPVSMDKVLNFVKENDARYLIIGVPCFVKAIHLLKKKEKIFNDRILYTASLFCGHLKTTHYLESIVSQFEVDKNEIDRFDFRHKIKGRNATDYGTEITLKNGEKKVKLNTELFGTNWGWGLFKLNACDYCDDVIGETADISFGDAWLPEYVNDYLGTNIIVIRNGKLNGIIKESIHLKKINYEEINDQKVYDSQAGGYRHRREGLAYRLYLKHKNNQWYPKKRVKPELIKNKKRIKIYDNRMKLQKISFNNIHFNNTDKLVNDTKNLILDNKGLHKLSVIERVINKIKIILK